MNVDVSTMNVPHAPFTDDCPSLEELAFWEVSAAANLLPQDESAAVVMDAPKPMELGERTARFGESVIRLARKAPFNPVNNPLIEQLVSAGTSPGANYCEANDSISTRDFKYRISICRKEAKEARYWLRMIATSEPNLKDLARVLWREATELNLIFSSIWRKA